MSLIIRFFFDATPQRQSHVRTRVFPSTKEEVQTILGINTCMFLDREIDKLNATSVNQLPYKTLKEWAEKIGWFFEIKPHEIMIRLPNSDACIRYYDWRHAKEEIPYMAKGTVETDDVNKHIKKQIFVRTLALPVVENAPSAPAATGESRVLAARRRIDEAAMDAAKALKNHPLHTIVAMAKSPVLVRKIPEECERVEPIFFKHFREKYPDDEDNCIFASYVLAHVLSKQHNLAMDGMSANRIEIEMGLKITEYADGTIHINPHAWVVIYINGEKMLFADAGHGQFDPTLFNRIFVGEYHGSMKRFGLLSAEEGIEYLIQMELDRGLAKNENTLRAKITRRRQEDHPIEKFDPQTELLSEWFASYANNSRISRFKVCRMSENTTSAVLNDLDIMIRDTIRQTTEPLGMAEESGETGEASGEPILEKTFASAKNVEDTGPDFYSFESMLYDKLSKIDWDSRKQPGVIKPAQEIALNIMLHGNGGNIKLYHAGNRQNLRELKLISRDRDEGPGITDDPNKLLKDSVRIHRLSRQVSRHFGKGYGFRHIVIYPDEIILETNSKKWHAKGGNLPLPISNANVAHARAAIDAESNLKLEYIGESDIEKGVKWTLIWRDEIRLPHIPDDKAEPSGLSHPKLPPIKPDENRPEELRRDHENGKRTARAL